MMFRDFGDRRMVALAKVCGSCSHVQRAMERKPVMIDGTGIMTMPKEKKPRVADMSFPVQQKRASFKDVELLLAGKIFC